MSWCIFRMSFYLPPVIMEKWQVQDNSWNGNVVSQILFQFFPEVKVRENRTTGNLLLSILHCYISIRYYKHKKLLQLGWFVRWGGKIHSGVTCLLQSIRTHNSIFWKKRKRTLSKLTHSDFRHHLILYQDFHSYKRTFPPTPSCTFLCKLQICSWISETVFMRTRERNEAYTHVIHWIYLKDPSDTELYSCCCW